MIKKPIEAPVITTQLQVKAANDSSAAHALRRMVEARQSGRILGIREL